MDKDNSAYTSLQIDLIRELVNIGGGNAATSISKLIDKPVVMDVPTIKVISYEELFETLPEDQMVSAVIIKISGDGEGTFLFITSEEASRSLLGMMLPEDMEKSEELADSAMKELVNIIASSYLNAISQELNITLSSSIPLMAKEMFGAILSSVYIETEQYDENILIMKNNFYYKGSKIDSSLYFVPKPGVLTSLFEIIGV